MENSYKELNKENEDEQLIEFNKVRDEYNEHIAKLNNNLANPHPITLGIRPEDIYIDDATSDFKAKIDVVELLGKEQILHTLINETKIDLVVSSKIDVKTGDFINLRFDTSSAHLYDVENDKAII